MADTTKGTLTDPQSVTIGSTSLTGIQSITWATVYNVLQAPPADAEVFRGTPRAGSAMVQGSIVFSNPKLADAAKNLAGTLGATFKGLGAQADITLAITLCQTMGADGNVSKDAAGSSTVNFVAGSEDGSTTPVSLT